MGDFSHIQGFRFFNVYGPGGGQGREDRDHLSVPLYIIAKTQGKIKLFEGSDQYRDFIHVDDVITCMLDNRKDSGIFDLGTSVPISFQDVGNLVAEKYKVTYRIHSIPLNIFKGKYQEFTT